MYLFKCADVLDVSRGDVEHRSHHSSGPGEDKKAWKLAGDVALRCRNESDFGHAWNPEAKQRQHTLRYTGSGYCDELQLFVICSKQHIKLTEKRAEYIIKLKCT